MFRPAFTQGANLVCERERAQNDKSRGEHTTALQGCFFQTASARRSQKKSKTESDRTRAKTERGEHAILYKLRNKQGKAKGAHTTAQRSVYCVFSAR